ncbi:TonB family protein [Methyloglobulus sp.]|uniref:energy transducer TonB n=1 Tax=Methyloglobulus sp. TaxID=2518622 RepID=UPI0039893E6F
MFTDLDFLVPRHFLENIPTYALGNNNYCGVTRRNNRSWISFVLVLLAHLTALAGLRPQPQNLSPETLPEPIMVSLLSAPQAMPQNSEPPSHPEQKMKRIVKPKAIEKKLTKRPAKPTTAITKKPTNKTLAEQSQNTSRLSVEQESTPEAEANSPPIAISGSPKTTKPDIDETSYQPPNFNPAYLHNPAPHYPSVSKRLGEQGRVLLRVQVSADGTAGSIALQASSGSARLDQVALESVKKWRFVPAKRGGQAISASVVVPVRFLLEG